MFKIFTNAFKEKDIRKKILYVIFIIAIYRLGTSIALPGVDIAMLTQAKTAGGQNALAMILGGNFGTIFYLGIGPYITSSIIMQLLTVGIPKLEQLQKEGQDGRNKINQYTRFLAVILSFVQGAGTVYSLKNTVIPSEVVTQGVFKYNNMFVYSMATLSLVTGTIFIMWLSELLTEKGFGNGGSFIIFANILSEFPRAIYRYMAVQTFDLTNILKTILVVFIFALLILFAVLIQGGERRIPVQYSKKPGARQFVGDSSSHIPLKVNIAGVMSIIFAVSIIEFPKLVSGFWTNDALKKIVEYLALTHYVGAIIYIILIFAFTFFYTDISINPIEMAENFRKSGGFIPGIRPGKPTSDYITKTVNNLSWIGATFYALIAISPILLEWIFGIKVGFGGTTLLIVSSVALEIIKQLESLLLMRHYKGFLN